MSGDIYALLPLYALALTISTRILFDIFTKKRNGNTENEIKAKLEQIEKRLQRVEEILDTLLLQQHDD